MTFLSNRDLGDENLTSKGLERLKRAIYGELDNVSAGELAIYFKTGHEYGRSIIRDYLETKPEQFRAEFQSHLQDPLLEERAREYGWLYE